MAIIYNLRGRQDISLVLAARRVSRTKRKISKSPDDERMWRCGESWAIILDQARALHGRNKMKFRFFDLTKTGSVD